MRDDVRDVGLPGRPDRLAEALLVQVVVPEGNEGLQVEDVVPDVARRHAAVPGRLLRGGQHLLVRAPGVVVGTKGDSHAPRFHVI